MVSPTRRQTLFDLSKYSKLKKQKEQAVAKLTTRGIFLSVSLAAFAIWLLFRFFLPLPVYQSRVERDFRTYRFPSIDDRVKLYMGDWYLPPCKEDWKIRVPPNEGKDAHTILLHEITLNNTSRELAVRSQVEVSILFFFNQKQLSLCSQIKWPIGPYCSDSEATVGFAKQYMKLDERIPILMQFGDEMYTRAYSPDNDVLLYNPILPHLKKFRECMPKLNPINEILMRAKNQCNNMTTSHRMQAIIWKLNAKRHFRDLYLVPRNDRKWHEKKDSAIFRGAATGEGLLSHKVDCFQLKRCQLVYQYATSAIVNAKLTKLLDQLPPVVDEIQLAGAELSQPEMLAYKGIIMLEGNDIASGLKWALLSKSVVLMPKPRFTSWAMEELLEPWVHYIPLKEDLSDVEVMVQWMLDHQAEARRISHRASLWIKDLVFHPDSEIDDLAIYQEILKRYAKYFQV